MVGAAPFEYLFPIIVNIRSKSIDVQWHCEIGTKSSVLAMFNSNWYTVHRNDSLNLVSNANDLFYLQILDSQADCYFDWSLYWLEGYFQNFLELFYEECWSNKSSYADLIWNYFTKQIIKIFKIVFKNVWFYRCNLYCCYPRIAVARTSYLRKRTYEISSYWTKNSTIPIVLSFNSIK